MKTIVALVEFTNALIGSLAAAILAETPKLNANLVIMGVHHHCALYNFFGGSTTAEVLQRALFRAGGAM